MAVKVNTRLSVLALVVILMAQEAFAREFRFGYGLVFSLNTLSASSIDAEFDDIPAGGHSSFFFVETPIAGDFSINMSPGAMVFEDGESQFQAQYNLLSMNYKMGSIVFPVAGAGLGGCIAAFTEGSGEHGTVQNGDFVRNSTLIWTGSIGVGYRFKNDMEFIVEGRSLGFFDDVFSSFDSYNVGATLSMKI